MSGIWFPAAIAASAVTLTYLFCIRPMRRSRCMMPAARKPVRGPDALDRALDDARTELAALRANSTPPLAPSVTTPNRRQDNQ